MQRAAPALLATVVVSLVALSACQPIQATPSIADSPPSISPSTAAAPVHSTTLDTEKYDNVYVYTIEERWNDGRSLLHVSYPVTDQDAINARMVEHAQQFITEFRTVSEEIESSYQEYKKETGKEAATFITQYRQNFDVTVANENLIFFGVTRHIDTGGTGNTSVQGFIFDRSAGDELHISALFVDERYLELLSSLTREALGERTRARIAEEKFETDADRKTALESTLHWIADGTAPTYENFDNLLFLDDGTILVRFDKYQVASGAEGVVEVSLPIDAVASLLKPEIRQLLGLEVETKGGNAEYAVAVERSLKVQPVTASSFVLTSAPLPARLGVQPAKPAASLAEEDISCYEVACVALTFDDGPSVYTPGLLDILQESNVQATFFVLGQSVRIQSETVLRMHEEGHQVANHTWNHPNLTQLPDDQIVKQLKDTNDLVYRITGEEMTLFRPPYGAYNDHVRASSDMPVILWSVDPLDWRDRDAEIVAARIIESPAGAIILAHDIHRTTVAAIPSIIVGLRERGFHFVTVTKLLGPQKPLSGHTYTRQLPPPSQ